MRARWRLNGRHTYEPRADGIRDAERRAPPQACKSFDHVDLDPPHSLHSEKRSSTDGGTAVCTSCGKGSAARLAAAVVAQRCVARPCQEPSIQFQMLQHLPMPPLPAAARPWPGKAPVQSHRSELNSLVFLVSASEAETVFLACAHAAAAHRQGRWPDPSAPSPAASCSLPCGRSTRAGRFRKPAFLSKRFSPF